ncbi:MAG TPA: molybdopterin oxidoreductase family protein [Vicinamibacterales bacterium]|nr:molybdopterin oxidoreductase family protein [Vicinamibacterales bacterium]
MAVPSQHSSTHCPYCALQCGVHLVDRNGALEVIGDAHFPVNQGGLCAKGWTATATLAHPDRLRTPLARNGAGVLQPVAWDEALDAVAAAFRRTQKAHGRDAVAVFGGGSLTNEKAYLLGKFARVALGTANIDYNGRFCMSSAAAAATRAFGIDRGLTFPLVDVEHAETILLVGGNMAETMPPIMRYFEAQQRNGGALIVVDPRRSATAQWATLHLALRPGSDAALANGLVHLLIREGLVDEAYIRERTEGFDDVRQRVAAYWPERVESLTGVPQRDLIEAAKKLGNARAVMVLTARGAEQQSHGVDNVLAFINVALALGAVGRPFSGFGTLTGQGNGQGGREHGQKADQLPGYRHIADPAARRHMAGVWGIDESDLPAAGKPAYELLDSAGRDGGIRSLFVLGSNPVVSAPNALSITARLAQLDFLVVSDFFLSETAELAHVVLPAAQFAEEDGTMTNLEGRVIRRRRAIDPPEGVRNDLDVLCALAGRMGKAAFFSFADHGGVFDELRRATRGAPADYSGITYDRIDRENGVFWPCPAEDHPGTPRLFIDRFPTATGRAHFSDVEHLPPAEAPDESFPLHLTTGRVLAHYQSGTQTRRVPALCEMAPEPLAEVHPQTARRHGVTDGTPVTLRTRRGTARFTAKVTRAIRPDTIFVPFHWGGDASANRLTIDAVDPVSGMPEFKVCAVRVEADGADIDD